jgi:hypothetical protein
LRDFEDGWNVVAKIQFLQGSLDVFACYGLFGVFFGDLVGLGGDEGDELNAAFYQEVARIFGKCHARLAGEDVLDDLLDGRCSGSAFTRGKMCGHADLWAATGRRCRQTRGQTWWWNARQQYGVGVELP